MRINLENKIDIYFTNPIWFSKKLFGNSVTKRETNWIIKTRALILYSKQSKKKKIIKRPFAFQHSESQNA